MNIRYVGTSTIREVGPYQWTPENGYVQDVTDPAILENLLTYPKPDFEAVQDETTVKQTKKAKTAKKEGG